MTHGNDRMSRNDTPESAKDAHGSVRLVLLVPPELIERLDDAAHERGEVRSVVTRDVLRRGLAALEEDR